MLHPDTKCLQEVTFQVTSHEGSLIISCATSLELGLIQPHRDLNVVPDNGSLIYSKADLLVKQKYKKSAAVYKLSNSVNSSEMQPPPESRVQETEVIQYVNKEVQTKSKQQQCQAPVPTVFVDKKCQATTCYKKVDSNCQTTNMWPEKPKMNMRSMPRPAKIQYSHKTKDQDDFKSQSAMCSDKKCQEIPKVDKRPKKPISHMQSVTKTNDMQ